MEAPQLLAGHEAAALADASLAARYVAAFAAKSAPALIANAASEALLMRWGEHDLPVTVDDGTLGRTYVSSPHSAYVLYARDEIALVGLGGRRRLAEGVLGLLDRLLRIIRINRAVHLDNWLLSTSLHGAWKGQGLAQMRAALAAGYPDHVMIIRSLDPWTCPELFAAVRADGWTLLPARQVWVTDDLGRDWSPRSHTKADLRALRRSGLATESPARLSAADAARIAALYHQLYVRRYSAINPIFTPRFIALAAELGLLDFCCARAPDGTIMAVSGVRVAGGVATVPLMGYDTERLQTEALYRIASTLACAYARERGLRFHGSAGASAFKRNRGARGVIEYMAVDARHLSLSRRAGLTMLAAALRRLMVPMLERNGW